VLAKAEQRFRSLEAIEESKPSDQQAHSWRDCGALNHPENRGDEQQPEVRRETSNWWSPEWRFTPG